MGTVRKQKFEAKRAIYGWNNRQKEDRIQAAFKKSGPLYEKLVDEFSEQTSSIDHGYSAQFSSFDNYLKCHENDKPLDLRITALLASIPPSNSDMERLFSFAKYLKTSIQGRMNTEVFTRNVFLKMTEGVDDMINKVATKVVTTRPCTVVVHDIE